LLTLEQIFMFNFRANHLGSLLKREYRSCSVFVVLGRSPHRVYRLHDFPAAHAMEPGSYYCGSGKVNSAGPASKSASSDGAHIDSHVCVPACCRKWTDGIAGMQVDVRATRETHAGLSPLAVPLTGSAARNRTNTDKLSPLNKFAKCSKLNSYSSSDHPSFRASIYQK
jgi:hypothetical protein